MFNMLLLVWNIMCCLETTSGGGQKPVMVEEEPLKCQILVSLKDILYFY
jgi:hypothetical protein